MRIPASNIEQLVVDRLRRLFSDPDSVLALTAARQSEPAHQQRLINRAAEIVAGRSTLSAAQMRSFLNTLIRRIELHPSQVDIHIYPARLATALGLTSPAMLTAPHSLETTVTLSVATLLSRAGKEMTLRSEPMEASQATPNPSLIKLIVRAHLFKSPLMRHGANRKFADRARPAKLNRSYFSRVLRLAYLAPDITRAILDGRQPLGLTAAMLVDRPNLPLAWPEQRKAFGFAEAGPART